MLALCLGCLRVWQGAVAMVQRTPYILGLDPERNMEPKLAWLKKIFVLDEEIAVRFAKVCCRFCFLQTA